jgi:hypothetical protein
MQNLRQRFPYVSVGLAIAVDDPAQVRLVNAQHLGQAVLTHADGINPQLQIRINVSIWGQRVTVLAIVPVKFHQSWNAEGEFN